MRADCQAVRVCCSAKMDGTTLAILMVSALSVSTHQICYVGSEFDPTCNARHRWVLLFKDPCKCNAIRLGGMTTSSSQQGAHYLDSIFLSEDPIEVSAFFNCEGIECSNPEPLGLEYGTIPDESISTSSRRTAGRGRLNGNVWYPWVSSGAWLEVDLGKSTVVSGVITQGGTQVWRVTEYKVKYKKLSSSDYDDIIDHNGAIQVFICYPKDARTPVTNMFDQSLVATIVRIEPVAFVYHVALRLELLGCHIN